MAAAVRAFRAAVSRLRPAVGGANISGFAAALIGAATLVTWSVAPGEAASAQTGSTSRVEKRFVNPEAARGRSGFVPSGTVASDRIRLPTALLSAAPLP